MDAIDRHTSASPRRARFDVKRVLVDLTDQNQPEGDWCVSYQLLGSLFDALRGVPGLESKVSFRFVEAVAQAPDATFARTSCALKVGSKLYGPTRQHTLASLEQEAVALARSGAPGAGFIPVRVFRGLAARGGVSLPSEAQQRWVKQCVHRELSRGQAAAMESHCPAPKGRRATRL